MKKYLLSFLLSVAGLGVANADEPITGIFATYDGSQTSYMLADVPSVKYETVAGVQYAVLYLKDVADPVLSVALADDKTLIVTYGVYTPTGVEDIAEKATITEQGGKKIIRGGKLIIIAKDGRMYDIEGRLLHQE